jgi:hypothetical protein
MSNQGKKSAPVPHEQPISMFEPNCFLICPFDKVEFTQTTREVISRACLACGFNSYRIDERKDSVDVMDKIRAAIRWASFVMADLSGKRDNCMYELGLAHAFERPTLILQRKQANQSIPFDVATNHILIYSNDDDLKIKLAKWIERTVCFSEGPRSTDDTCKGMFGRLALRNGYLLSGYVTRDPLRSGHGENDDKPWYDAYLSLRRIDGQPICQKAKFTLDRTFVARKLTRKSGSDGIVRLRVNCYGAFTVGVRIEETRLEIDLAHAPGSSPAFRYEN